MQIEVPLFQQEEGWSCLAACVRMCMSATGDHRTETEWRLLIGTGRLGTTFEDTRLALKVNGIDVDRLLRAELDSLHTAIAISRPVIVSTYRGRTLGRMIRHAVVVVGATADELLVNDPAEGSRIRVSADRLMSEWIEAGAAGLLMPAV